MALETADAFAVMSTAYRVGVLDKMIPLVGLALEGCQERAGLEYGDVYLMMDEARPETIEKLDRLFKRSGFLLRLADNELLLRVFSRLMDLDVVKRATTALLTWVLLKVVGASGNVGRR